MSDHIKIQRQKQLKNSYSYPQLATDTSSVRMDTTHGSANHDISLISLRPQARLTVSQPGDIYEREADKVAQQVMGMSDRLHDRAVQREVIPQAEEENLQLKSLANPITPLVQREEENLQMKPVGNFAIQREELPEEEKEEIVQAKSSLQRVNDGGLAASSNISDKLHSRRGEGSPLADDVRSFMEPRFGVDFSHVRVHTDGEAVQMTKDVGAQAFTYGSDLYFGAGKSPGHNELTAHELTHVVQQSNGLKQVQRQRNASQSLKTQEILIVIDDNAVLRSPPPDLQQTQEIIPRGTQVEVLQTKKRGKTKKGQSNLEKLRKMLGKFDIPESQVINLLPKLTPQEKMTVVTDAWYKKRMVKAFSFEEMVRAMANLNPSLSVKLSWVNEAAITTRAIEYSEIKSFIVNSPISERKVLSSQYWRDFFIKVCDNKTIITAVKDFNFDPLTRIEWILEEGNANGWLEGGIDPAQAYDALKSFFKGEALLFIELASLNRWKPEDQKRLRQIMDNPHGDSDAAKRAEKNATTEVEVITFLYGEELLDTPGEAVGYLRGHTALVVGGLVYSFETSWSCGHTKASYLAKPKNVSRDGIGQILKVTEEDAKKLQANLNQSCGKGVYLVPDICTGKASKALEDALKLGLHEVENPQLFVGYLEATGLVESRRFYPKKEEKSLRASSVGRK